MKSNNICGWHVLRIAAGITMLVLLMAGGAGAATLTVDDSGGADYTSIQDAIDAANPGDTILVYSGIYFENVNVTKQLELRGQDNGGGMPVVNALGAGNAITINADGVILDGFNAKTSIFYSGIKVTSNNNVIKNNNASNNRYGITMYDSSNNKLSDNIASNNYLYGIYLDSSSNNTLNSNVANLSQLYDGIFLSYSNNNTLSSNIANLNGLDGIRLSKSSNNILSNNTAKMNDEGGTVILLGFDNILIGNTVNSNGLGIGLLSSSNNIINSNNASNNALGIELDQSNNNTIASNVANSNKGYRGVFLSFSNNNTLINNIVNFNDKYGIYLSYSHKNTLSSNTINSNKDYGIYLSSSIKNTIYNNFFNNTNNHYTPETINNWNTTKTPGANIIGGPYLGGNFWAHPNGTGFSQTCADADSDGICDSSYTLASENIDYLPLAAPVSPPAGNRACAAMCHYYRKPVNADFYPNANTSYDRLETFLGILSDRSLPWTNVTNPRMEFWWNSSQLYNNTWDYFRKTQPDYYNAAGYANFTLSDFSPDKVEDGTYAVDIGARNETTGYSVARAVTNDGFVPESGNYTINITVMLYEYTDYLSIGVNLDERDEVKAKVQNWSASGSPSNNTDKNMQWINIGYDRPSYPAQYNFSVTYYVKKITPGNITYKPSVWVDRQITKQWNDTIGNTRSVSIKGKQFNMNSSFYSDNPVQWTYGEQFVRAVELQSVIELIGAHANFKFIKSFEVNSTGDSIASGAYNKNPWYILEIKNTDDTSDTVLGNLSFGVRALNITDVGKKKYATWNNTSANWTLPFTLHEEDENRASFKTNYSETRFLNVNLTRWMNRTEFNTTGIQLVKGTVTFKDGSYSPIWLHIEANNYPEVNASVVGGTGDIPLKYEPRIWDHGIDAEIDESRLQPNRTYNFSILIKIEPVSGAVIYKPSIAVGQSISKQDSSGGGTGYTEEMPDSKLPDNVEYASVTTNVSNAWTLGSSVRIAAELEEVAISTQINIPPIAVAFTNHTINNIGSKAFLNASASYDPDGYITAYNWNFGDGTAGSGSIVSHIYNTYKWNGTAYLPFNVLLTITDNDGATNSTVLKLKVYIAGDANGDGKVNILDTAKIGLSWNTKYGDAKYDDGADLNNDDKVNILDMAIVGLNWNKKAVVNV